ncbi:hypothetical protein TNCV_1427531 [Trichonephila clavipes]|nr:hypothetical protein TNCV_1427531 [Trichonephila clavipes]
MLHYSNGLHLFVAFMEMNKPTNLAIGKSWSRLLDGQRCAQRSALPRGNCGIILPARATSAIGVQDALCQRRRWWV